MAEFVLLALPLFVPALIFFLSMSQTARSEMEASMVAREALKTFTTSENDLLGHIRVRALLEEYEEISGFTTQFIADPKDQPSTYPQNILEYSVRCEAFPCLTPGAQVELTLFLNFSILNIGYSSQTMGESSDAIQKERRAIGTAVGFVDRWN